jgi:23S rRNA (adenine2503-C2)-methyltransferase
MTNSISIFSHTYHSFCDEIHKRLGKGQVHAGLIYEEFFRTGKVTASSKAFANAKSLLHAILALVDFTPIQPSCGQKSDGFTGKILLKTHDHLEIETVLIPMHSGGTLCVSSQVGCRMGCAFCETGKMGLLRNLTVLEIVSQVFIARHHLNFDMRNIVFMGMGEPFDNYDNVMQAVKVLSDPKGLGFGSRHITISTSGCVDKIRQFALEGDWTPNLAVSVNASTDEERNRLMPVNKRFDMQQLYEGMDFYCSTTKKQILAAYVLLKDRNDTLEHADRLAAYLKGLDVKVNLIPYNPQTRDRFSAPDPQVINAFVLRMREHGYRTLLRATKGQQIMAACGQLGNVKLRTESRLNKVSTTSVT